MGPIKAGMIDLPRAQVRQYGLGRILLYARQKAINLICGPQTHWSPNSMPLCNESAFEYLGNGDLGAADIAALAFQNFSRPLAELDKHFIYQRLNGPNDTALALTLGEALTVINDREIKAIVGNAGMSTFTAFFDLLRPGDTLLYHPVLYGCTKNKVVSHLPKMNITVRPENFQNLTALRNNLVGDLSIRMIVTETELNPTLEIPPLDRVAQIVNEANEKRLAKGWRPVILVVDNTFPTFANMNPLGLGIHCVLESMTKFICGTGENMGGFIAVDDYDFHLTDQDYGSIFNYLMMMQKDDGLSMSPFPAWDILRMLPSIEMRRTHVQVNAQKVAEFLKTHPKLSKVNYPGMIDDAEQDARAQRLMRDEQGNFAPGYLVYFVLKGNPEEVKDKGKRLLNWLSENTSLKVKVSFGQQDTCIEMPSIMTHSSYKEAELIAAGIDPGGIRLAIGWDNADYIIDSLNEGLKQI